MSFTAAMLIAALLVALLLLWRLRRALAQALEARDRATAVLDSSDDAILTLGPDGMIDQANAAVLRMLGYRPEELHHRDAGTILDPARGGDNFHSQLARVDGRLRRSFLPDQVARHRDGHAVAVDVATGIVDVPGGTRVVLSLRDISERKRLGRIRDDMVSTASHEMRTPLTSVIGSLGLLKAGAGGALPPEASRLVEIAEGNSRRLIRLINDMLDVDRIGSGKLALDCVPVDLRTVVEQACSDGEGLALPADIALVCPPDDDPVVVVGDIDRLVQVVANLVSNAVRAAPSGSAVEIGLASVDGRAILSVADRGAGVPVAFRDRIFGRFERATSDEGTLGTGLGLAISREIVVRHGGTIWFEDRAGGGTRFAFAIPLATRSQARDERVAGAGPAEVRGHLRRVGHAGVQQG